MPDARLCTECGVPLFLREPPICFNCAHHDVTRFAELIALGTIRTRTWPR